MTYARYGAAPTSVLDIPSISPRTHRACLELVSKENVCRKMYVNRGSLLYISPNFQISILAGLLKILTKFVTIFKKKVFDMSESQNHFPGANGGRTAPYGGVRRAFVQNLQ